MTARLRARKCLDFSPLLMPREPDQPVVLSKWYSVVKWLLEKVDNFPKNQRFVFGTRLADRALTILETLVEASYARDL
jgi:hypothetical protein